MKHHQYACSQKAKGMDGLLSLWIGEKHMGVVENFQTILQTT